MERTTIQSPRDGPGCKQLDGKRSRFDPHRQVHFLRGGEEGYPADLLEIHPDGVEGWSLEQIIPLTGTRLPGLEVLADIIPLQFDNLDALRRGGPARRGQETPRSVQGLGRATFELLVMGGDGGNGSIQLQLGHGGASPAVDVILTPTCTPVESDPTIKVYEVEGGCVTYRSSLPAGVGPVPSFGPGGGLSFVPRSQLVAFVDQDENLILCGAGAACP